MDPARSLTESVAGGAPIGPLRLLFGLLGAPVGWSVHLLASYLFVTLGCAGVLTAPLTWLIAASVTSGFITALAGISAFRSWKRLRAAHQAGNPPRDDAALLMSRTGFLLSAMFLLGIVLAGIPPLVLGSCG